MFKNIHLSKEYSALLILFFFIFFFSTTNVNAQFQGGGNRNIPCKDSTPTCPCVLPNGDCFDIDTPIDNELKILVIGGILIGLYRLHTNYKLQKKTKNTIEVSS